MSDDEKLANFKLLIENETLKKELEQRKMSPDLKHATIDSMMDENAHLRAEIKIIAELCQKHKERAERFLSESAANAEAAKKYEDAIDQIDLMLRIPAAEYVTEIGCIFTLIDKLKRPL